MPFFSVIDSQDNKAPAQFAYADNSQPLQEAGTFATLYLGYAVDSHGKPTAGGEQWVIKESHSRDFRARFDDEVRLLRELARQTVNLTGGQMFSPYPAYLLERIDTPLPAIAYPHYSTPLRDVISSLDEPTIIDQMINYGRTATAYHQMPSGGYAYLDRTVDDLYWSNNRIMIINWNSPRPLNDQRKLEETRLMGRIWYLLLTGSEPPLNLNPFNDVEWLPERLRSQPGRNPAQISIGLRQIIVGALGGSYSSIDVMDTALYRWREAYQQDSAEPAEIVQENWRLDSLQAQAVAADLRWRKSSIDENWQARQEILAVVLGGGEMTQVRAALDEAARAIREGRLGDAHDQIRAVEPEGAVQSAAVERYRSLLDAFTAPDLERGRRDELRPYLSELIEGIQRLQHPVQNDQAAEVQRPLARVMGDFERAARQMPPGESRAKLMTLMQEALLRQTMLEASRLKQSQHEQGQYAEALRKIIEASRAVPYIENVIDLGDIERRVEMIERNASAGKETESKLQTVHDAMMSLLRAQEIPTDFTPVSEAIRAAEIEIESMGIDYATNFVSQVKPYRRFMIFLTHMREQSPAQIAEQADDLQRSLPSDVLQLVTPTITRVVRERAHATLDQIEATLRQGDAARLEQAELIRLSLTSPAVGRYLDADLRRRLQSTSAELENQRKFVRWVNNNLDATNLDIVQQAKDLGLSLTSGLVAHYVQDAIKEAGDRFQNLEAGYDSYRSSVNQLLTQQRQEYDLTLESFQRRVGMIESGVQQISARLDAVSNTAQVLQTQLERRFEEQQRMFATRASAGRRGCMFLFTLIVIVAGLGAVGYYAYLNAEQQSSAIAALETANAQLRQQLDPDGNALAAVTEALEPIETELPETEPTATAAPTRAPQQTDEPTEESDNEATPIVIAPSPRANLSDPLTAAPALANQETSPVSLLEVSLLTSEAAGLQAIKENTPDIDGETYALGFGIEGGSIPLMFATDDTSVFHAIYSGSVLPLVAAVDSAGGSGLLLLSVRENDDVVTVSPALFVNSDEGVELEQFASLVPPRAVITFNQQGEPNVFDLAQTDAVPTVPAFSRVDADFIEQIEAAMGVRNAFITLPEAGDLILVQIDPQGQVASLLLNDQQVSFFTSAAVSSGDDAVVLRSRPDSDSPSAGSLEEGEQVELAAAGLLDNDDIEALDITIDDLAADRMLPGNQVAVDEGDSRWLLAQMTDVTVGWVDAEVVEVEPVGLQENAPSVAETALRLYVVQP